jgi:hypothetical protein
VLIAAAMLVYILRLNSNGCNTVPLAAPLFQCMDIVQFGKKIYYPAHRELIKGGSVSLACASKAAALYQLWLQFCSESYNLTLMATALFPTIFTSWISFNLEVIEVEENFVVGPGVDEPVAHQRSVASKRRKGTLFS